MGGLLANNKALIAKVLTGIVGTAVGWANKKYGWGIDPVGLTATVVSIILGIALHAAAKDHGVNAAPDGGAK
jgi:hypothetical protein